MTSNSYFISDSKCHYLYLSWRTNSKYSLKILLLFFIILRDAGALQVLHHLLDDHGVFSSEVSDFFWFATLLTLKEQVTNQNQI